MNIIAMIFRRAVIIITMISAVACTSTPPKPRERGALVDLLLRPDAKKPGIFSSGCASCEAKRLDFDLRDEPTRLRLINARFICKVGHKQFRICRIIPGLCHQSEVSTGWGPWKKTYITLLEVLEAEKDHQKLVDLNVMCAAMGSEVASEFFTD